MSWKKEVLLYVLILFFVSIFLAPVALASSQALSSIEVEDLLGKKVNTDSFLGGYVIFDIWATWCPPCIVAMQDYQANLDLFEEEEISLVAISVDDRVSSVQDFVKKHTIAFTVLHDPRYAVGLWQVRALPTLFVVAPDGEILLRKEGYGSFPLFWEAVSSAIQEHRSSSAAVTLLEQSKEQELALMSSAVRNLQGEDVAMEEFVGEFTLFKVWATWCAPCRESMSERQDHLSTLDEAGIQLVAISIDEKLEDIEIFIEKTRITFPVFHDYSQAFLGWGVEQIPTTFLVGPNGSILLKKTGYAPFSVFFEELEAAIEGYSHL